MAKAPAHQFGQIIGLVLEAGLEPELRVVANRHGLYLDKKGLRPARRGKALRWKDLYGNIHQLDFVMERGGTPSLIGTPVAFIEAAYRRYTKHSRNKVQEIEGAILPLAQTYRDFAPFMGAVLAGVFTGDSLSQLKSRGFTVLYFPYHTVNQAFMSVGIDVTFDEGTSDDALWQKIEAWKSLPEAKYERVGSELMRLNASDVESFVKALEQCIARRIERVRILPLHGETIEHSTVKDAVHFVQSYREDANPKSIVRYEIEIRYNTGDRIVGEFATKGSAVQFLSQHLED